MISKKQLAIFSPLPPTKSGISDYSIDLGLALSESFNITYVIDENASLPNKNLIKFAEIIKLTQWNKRNKRGMMPNNMIEKIREEDRKKRAQGYPGRIGDIRFTNEGSVRLPSGLRLSGEGPLFLPTLNLNLHHGLVRVKRSQAGLKNEFVRIISVR